ncbi:MAG: transaldolase, partial [Acidimicrobiia bacterium]|nr:transaldolase [Acidimicrobiia bacterium]
MSETKLQELHREQGQSPWLDNLKRGYITSGDLQGMVERGIRGITSNPTIFAKAIEGGGDYDSQFQRLVEERTSIDDAYWDLVIDDIRNALRILRPVYDESGGEDGFVSIEVAPGLARNTGGTVAAARQLHERINQPNLYVKIPATPEGVPAIRQMVSEGHNINITLMFSLGRYDQVIEAYFQGLEAYQGDLSQVRSVASFFVSRVDTEVDRRLEAIGSDEALGLRGQAAVAQAKLAYQLFRQRFQGGRWEELRARGANLQRPLWASTSTKNPAYSDLLYVE